ncbi:hypothetical protein Tsp_10552 [Trichinella spiralis]|uniref:hypothetical protein n=1 Tax=Trichinella spiralis TaxID=6334 RepID=UPI0001EFD58A|nr:hypothetical protein Tsp_10552 [Trichinella spiralis]
MVLSRIKLYNDFATIAAAQSCRLFKAENIVHFVAISAVLPPPTVNAACTVCIQDQTTAHAQSVFYAISS